MFGHRGGMRRHFLHYWLCAQITFIEPQTWLVCTDSSHFRNRRPFGGVCLDHFPVVFCTHRCGQRHDGQCHLLRLYLQRLRRLRRRGGVHDLCTGGDDERQNYCQSVAVLRHLRRGHRRHDHRRPILVSQQLFAARRQNHVCGPYVQLHADSCRHMHHHRQLLRHLRTGDHRTATAPLARPHQQRSESRLRNPTFHAAHLHSVLPADGGRPGIHRHRRVSVHATQSLAQYMRQRPAVRHAAAVRAPAVACATPVQSSDGGLRPDRARMRCILGQYDDGSQHPHQCGGVGWSGVPRLVHRVLAPDRRHRGRSRGRSVVARAGHRRRF